MKHSFAPFLLALFACPRPPIAARNDDRTLVADEIALFRTRTLEPAKIPPPSIGILQRDLVDGSLVARASFERPEEESWNRWTAGGLRLFNNRSALLFRVEISGPGPLSWDPSATTLEVNDERTILPAAPTAEVLLADLLLHAYLEQQWALGDDLLNRTRGAGPFRMAYTPTLGAEALSGLIAFPLGAQESTHIVALRLTVSVQAADGPHTLVWIFD